MKKLLSLPLLLLCACHPNEPQNTLLGWCIWEIQTNEGYDSDYNYHEHTYVVAINENGIQGKEIIK